MPKRKPILLALAAVVIIPIAAVGWWLLSPLFIEQRVDEELPFSVAATVPLGMEREDAEEIMSQAAQITQGVDEPMPDMMPVSDETTQDDEADAIEEIPALDQVVDDEPSESMAPDEEEPTMDDLSTEGQVIPTPESVVMADETPEAEAMESTATPTPTPEPTPVPTPMPEPTAVPTPVQTAVAQPEAIRLKIGNFQDADSFHRGSGEAVIYRGPDGSHLLRLENFNVTNGPDLHVILTPRQNPTSRNDVKSAGYADLGSLKGNTGNQNYAIPEDVDIASIESVVIYCMPFHVIFSVASLQDAG